MEKYAKTPVEAFILFFTKSMIKKIVCYTNAVIQPAIERLSDLFEQSDKYRHFLLVEQLDLEVFIRILYLRAPFRVNFLNREFIWNHESSHDVFTAMMPEKRFKFISCFITFDHKGTRADRWKTNKFACIRELFEAMNERNAKLRYPSPQLTIDETLYPYRSCIDFKQSNPSKPAKYGLLYRSLCDSMTTYTSFTLPYAGKPESTDGPAGKYYLTGTNKYTKYLVSEFSAYNSIQECNISMDRYFTSVSLAAWALENKSTIVGNMHHDRKAIPKEVKALSN